MNIFDKAIFPMLKFNYIFTSQNRNLSQLMRSHKRSPKLQPYPRTKTRSEFIKDIIVSLTLISIMSIMPLVNTISSCCFNDGTTTSTMGLWQIEAIAWGSTILMAFILQTVLIIIEADEGKWITVSNIYYDQSAMQEAFNNIGHLRKIAFAGFCIVGMLIIVLPGNAGALSILGALTGFLLAHCVRSSFDLYLDLRPMKRFGEQVTQQSMQKYLEVTYGIEVTEHLLAEARKDVKRWRARVRRQEGLETWAAKTYEELEQSALF
ncbi:MAG: hypothetical protein GY943_08835 [Chloroflexi bacterium]|nr:hypothetical protein [Chloroflexota bacterium]